MKLQQKCTEASTPPLGPHGHVLAAELATTLSGIAGVGDRPAIQPKEEIPVGRDTPHLCRAALRVQPARHAGRALLHGLRAWPSRQEP